MTSKHSVACAALLLGLVSLGATAARADVMYTYTGYDFTSVTSPFTKSDSVSGYFIMSQPLGKNLSYERVDAGGFPPTALFWSFTDGVNTITSDTPGLTADQVAISTNGAGQISLWAIQVGDSVHDAVSTWDDGSPGSGNTFDYVSYNTGNDNLVSASNTSRPGIWTETPVPEPPSVAVLITALLGLALHRRRRIPG